MCDACAVRFVASVQPTGSPRPPVDVGPVPNERPTEPEHRFGKVGMPPSPIVNHLQTLDAQTLGNLGAANELLYVKTSSHL